MLLRAKKLFAGAASRQAAKIGVIASPFLAAARPNSNTTRRGPYIFAKKSLQKGGHLLRLEMLSQEVRLLQQLRHPHIVRLVGTLNETRFFSILIYPAAEWNLRKLDVQHAVIGRINCSSTVQTDIYNLEVVYDTLNKTAIFVDYHAEKAE
jgi:hypothetical protein